MKSAPTLLKQASLVLRGSVLAVAVMFAIPSVAHANQANIIRIPALIQLSDNDDQFWKQIDAYATDWSNVRAEYACSVWTPDP